MPMILPLTNVRANYSCTFFFFLLPLFSYKDKKEGKKVTVTCQCGQGETYYSGVTTFFLPLWEDGTCGH